MSRALAVLAALAVGCWTSEEASVFRPSCPPPETAPAIDKRAVARIETATFALG